MICEKRRLFAGGGVLLFASLVLLLDQAAVVPTVFSWSLSGLRKQVVGAGTSKGERSAFRNLAAESADGATIHDRNSDVVGGCILIFFGTLDRGEREVSCDGRMNASYRVLGRPCWSCSNAPVAFGRLKAPCGT